MELRHLRYFVAVAEALSFRRAAERLRVSQPALSKQIRDLEEEWNARLFDRNTAGVRLTDAGVMLVDEARAILAHAERLGTLVRGAADGRHGRLTIGNIGSLTAGFLPASLTAFHAKYPGVDVSLIELRSREQRAALLSGRIQIGLFGGPATPTDPDFEQVLVAQSPLRAFLSRQHRLARRPRIALEDLEPERLLAVTSEPGASGHVDTIRALFVSRGLRPPPIKVVDSLESLLALIASDQGLSIIPGLIGREHGTRLLTKPLNVEGESARFSLWGVWRRNETSQLVRNFVNVLQAQTSQAARRARTR
jgi:DNA-binding transcriptional LysR family regulator